MLLSKLIEVLPEKEVLGQENVDITSMTYHSGRVSPGALFACIRGDKFDGHRFARDAVEKGAVAVLADDPSGLGDLGVPVVRVADTRKALPMLANLFFGYPSRRLKLVGVTGTKGKTTTTYLMESVFRACGMGAGVIGTLGARVNGESVPMSDRTTPEAVDLQELLAHMVERGVSGVAMEVSSHALVKERTAGSEFDVGIFTNLTHDHLDFHKTLDEYLAAKLMLFSEYPLASSKPFTAVVNADDERAGRVREATRGRVLTYGIRNPADIRAESVSAGADGVSFDIAYPGGRTHIDLRLGGMFNVYNSLAAFSAGIALGLDPEMVRAGLESPAAVPGRFESVNCGQEFGVLVDYAHTPDSLENVLRSARELTSGRLIVVFGCGGDRDRTKRPVMGGIGSRMADVCIITSDNPRTEQPESIIAEILSGVDGAGTLETITDRRAAIGRALSLARPGDLVVIAGKGHETYQIFKDETVHFDDREVVRELLLPHQ